MLYCCVHFHIFKRKLSCKHLSLQDSISTANEQISMDVKNASHTSPMPMQLDPPLCRSSPSSPSCASQ